MNMTAYQNFCRFLEFAKKNQEDRGFQEMAIRRKMKGLKEFYAVDGVTDEEVIVASELRKNAKILRETSMFLETSTVFELDDKNKYLLVKTGNPKFDENDLWNEVRLPFPEIFIDVSFDSDEMGVQDIAKINGLLIRELKTFAVNIDPVGKNISKTNIYGLSVYLSGITAEGNAYVDNIQYPIVSEDGDLKGERLKGASKFIKQFIVNFLLFLKEREVVFVESQRSPKNQERRIKEGKMPLPSSRIIKLTGELLRYVNSIDTHMVRGKLKFKTDVCGTWRHYRSSRYVNAQGKLQWINAYERGKGLKVKHTYKVVPNEQKDVLDYDDIEMGKEKLKDIAR